MTETATDPIPKTILFHAVNSNPAADLTVGIDDPPVTVTGALLFAVGFAVGAAVVGPESVCGPARAEIPTPVRAADVCLVLLVALAPPRTSPSSSQKS